MTWDHVHREEAPSVGDPVEENESELLGIAPPCSECGRREAVRTANGRELCDECFPRPGDDQEGSDAE